MLGLINSLYTLAWHWQAQVQQGKQVAASAIAQVAAITQSAAADKPSKSRDQHFL